MSNRTILITGASRGIGLAAAQRLAADGHEVIGLARHTPPDFPGHFYTADLTDAQALDDALARVCAAHEVDAVINNAGLTTSRTIEHSVLLEFEKIIAVNLRACMQTVQACLPVMKKRGNGRIINVSSRAALGMAGRSAYSAAKSGVIGFTRTWALELGVHGINVNAIAPGPVATDLYLQNNPMSDDARQALMQRIPLKRLGRPEDIAGVAAFLMSDDASFMTGQVLYVCGGLSVGAAPM